MDKNTYFSWLTNGIAWVWNFITNFITNNIKWILLIGFAISVIFNIIFLFGHLSVNVNQTQTQYQSQTMKSDTWNINQNQNVNLNLIYDRILFASNKKVIYVVTNIAPNNIDRFIASLGFFEYMNTKIVYMDNQFKVFFPTFEDVNVITKHISTSITTNSNYNKQTNTYNITFNKMK